MITLQIAIGHSSHPDELQDMINRGVGDRGRDRGDAAAADKEVVIHAQTIEWKGRDRNGTAQSGVLVADSKEAVIAALRRQQIVVTTVKEKGKEIALPQARRGNSARRTSRSSPASSR